jgi:nucleoside-diphosphate-sugar epimerase
MAAFRILITGINGLIGGILQSAFHEYYKVFGLDLDGPFSDRVVQADISRYHQVAKAVQKYSPLDSIVHLAGNPRVKASWEEVLEANIVGTRNVFEAAREYQVPRVIFASSNHVTGAHDGIEPELNPDTGKKPDRISPSQTVRPDSEYGLSKACGELIARYYFDKWGVQAICLRIGAVLKNNDPTGNPQNGILWLSYRDLVQLVEKSLTADVGFGIYYGISDNKGAVWDFTNARQELGYEPADDSSTR